MRWPTTLFSKPRDGASSWRGCSVPRLPAGHSRGLRGRGRAECRVGQIASAARRGFLTPLGASVRPCLHPQQHPRAGVSERQRRARARLPCPSCLSCLPLVPHGSRVPISHQRLAFSLHAPGFWRHCSLPLMKEGGASCLRSAADLLSVAALTPASSWGRGPWWALPVSLDPEPAWSGPPWLGAELEAGPGTWVSGA